jgi:bifunctional DNA-binding transcriptional regulator/antitoxin component of YhaV-PrlF toxin-antitoxin module
MAGYSGTPLAKKLGIKEGNQVCVINGPEGYLKLLEPLPEEVQFAARVTKSTDVIHIFHIQRTALEKALSTYRDKIKPTAALWVSWPKKSAKVPTDITEDTVREVALPMGFVDIKVCAVDEVWSGLKLVIRKELR